MKNLLALSLFLSTSIFCNSQTTFHRYYGGSEGDNIKAAIQTQNGGFMMVGESWSGGYGSEDIMIVNTDADGKILWDLFMGSSSSEKAMSVAQTADGGYIVGGNISTTIQDAFLVKLTATGTVSWANTYGGTDIDNLHSVKQTSDGGYIFAGYSYSFNSGKKDNYIVKTDANGTVVWSNLNGTSSDDKVWSILETNDKGFILAGESKGGSFGGMDLVVQKLNADGTVSWKKYWGTSNTEAGNSILELSNGDILVAGETGGFSGDGNLDVFMLLLASDGSLKWGKVYGSNSPDEDPVLTYNSASNQILITAKTLFPTPGNGDILIIKTDMNGDTLLTKIYGRTSNDYGVWGKILDNGMMAFAGVCQNYTPLLNNEFYLFTTNSTGNSNCNEYNTTLTVTTATNQLSSSSTSTHTGTNVTVVNFQTKTGVSSEYLCPNGAGVNEKVSPDLLFSVIPNPSSTSFFLKISTESFNNLHSPEIIITDVLHRKIRSEKIISPVHEIQTSSLNPGIYFLNIPSNEKKLSVRKFIVN